MYEARYKDRIFAPGPLARAIVSGLVKKGHDVLWFTAPEDDRGTTLMPGNTDLLTKDLRFRVFQDMAPEIVKTVSLYGSKMYYELDVVGRAYGMAQKEHLDVIHNFHSFAYMAHFFQEVTGVPTVYTLHDPIPTDDMLERWLFTRFPTHKYISLSDRQRGNLGDHFIGTVPNGIDPALFPFSPEPGEGLVAVGRMVPEKGQDIAISVAKSTGKRLTLASWISDSVRQSAYYKEKIAPYVDGKNIVVNSLMDGKTLADMYQHAEALIFPLQWEEPFGLTMIEAMASGTPVVAFDRGSVSEVVKDGVTGFVVAPGAGVAGLVAAVKKIGEIDRAACRKHVEEHFTLDTMVAGYETMYRKLLSETKPV
jgi:glycosyltransferase involved in cell wall biosynthesis